MSIISKLRNMTVQNGCTYAEATNARNKLNKLLGGKMAKDIKVGYKTVEGSLVTEVHKTKIRVQLHFNDRPIRSFKFTDYL